MVREPQSATVTCLRASSEAEKVARAAADMSSAVREQPGNAEVCNGHAVFRAACFPATLLDGKCRNYALSNRINKCANAAFISQTSRNALFVSNMRRAVSSNGGVDSTTLAASCRKKTPQLRHKGV